MELLLNALNDASGVWTFGGEDGDAPNVIAIWRGGREVEMWLLDSGSYDPRDRIYFDERPDRGQVAERVVEWVDANGAAPTAHAPGCKHVAVYDGDGSVVETELVCVAGCRATF